MCENKAINSKAASRAVLLFLWALNLGYKNLKVPQSNLKGVVSLQMFLIVSAPKY